MAPSRNRVAVVCAAHAGNSGMHSVDLAAVRFFRECGCDFTLFTANPNQSARATLDGVGVELLTDPATFGDYTHVVFWGDFLNNPQYAMNGFSFRHRKTGLTGTLGPAYPFWRRLFTLHENPELDARIYAIGGNFQHPFDDPRMVEDLRRMADRFTLFCPRDPFSTRNLCRFMPFEALSRVQQGMDPAFLLRPPARPPAPGGHFCWFFGRSNLTDTGPLIKAVEKATGLRGHHLERWLRLPADRADQGFNQQRELIGSARFVLTDTYHLLINSITVGTPTIPLARPAPVQQGTLGDFKKLTLLDMLGLSHRLLLVPPEDEAPDSATVVAAAHGILAGEAADDYLLAWNLADKFRADLKRELFGSGAASRASMTAVAAG